MGQRGTSSGPKLPCSINGRLAGDSNVHAISDDQAGYYDGVIFHRIVPGFIVQTGDPTGTGTGGESFYGEPFQDEIHGRLRFNKFVSTPEPR